MVLINGTKYACERCIRGHRVTTCTHTDQPLMMIKPKGRPATQCQHCRDLRKNKNSHTLCTCGKKTASGKHLSNCICNKTSHCTCLKKKKKSDEKEKDLFLKKEEANKEVSALNMNIINSNPRKNDMIMDSADSDSSNNNFIPLIDDHDPPDSPNFLNSPISDLSNSNSISNFSKFRQIGTEYLNDARPVTINTRTRVGEVSIPLDEQPLLPYTYQDDLFESSSGLLDIIANNNNGNIDAGTVNSNSNSNNFVSNATPDGNENVINKHNGNNYQQKGSFQNKNINQSVSPEPAHDSDEISGIFPLNPLVGPSTVSSPEGRNFHFVNSGTHNSSQSNIPNATSNNNINNNNSNNNGVINNGRTQSFQSTSSISSFAQNNSSTNLAHHFNPISNSHFDTNYYLNHHSSNHHNTNFHHNVQNTPNSVAASVTSISSTTGLGNTTNGGGSNSNFMDMNRSLESLGSFHNFIPSHLASNGGLIDETVPFSNSAVSLNHSKQQRHHSSSILGRGHYLGQNHGSTRETDGNGRGNLSNVDLSLGINENGYFDTAPTRSGAPGLIPVDHSITDPGMNGVDGSRKASVANLKQEEGNANGLTYSLNNDWDVIGNLPIDFLDSWTGDVKPKPQAQTSKQECLMDNKSLGVGNDIDLNFDGFIDSRYQTIENDERINSLSNMESNPNFGNVNDNYINTANISNTNATPNINSNYNKINIIDNSIPEPHINKQMSSNIVNNNTNHNEFFMNNNLDEFDNFLDLPDNLKDDNFFKI